jgi:hypothetical protein
VAELVKLGVDKNRLIAQGYGIFCPVDEGTTEDALEKNRRVEFKILQLGGKSTDIKRGCENAVKNKVKMKVFAPLKADAAKAGAAKTEPAKALTPAPKPAPKPAGAVPAPAAPAPAAPKK